MKKFVTAALTAVMVITGSTAFASLDDTKDTIEKQYGEYRMAIDNDNQFWPKAEWEKRGKKRAKAASYAHVFERQGLGIQMEVMYLNDDPGAIVEAQRFTPNTAIKIKEFKDFFPEVYQLVKDSKAQAFASYEPVTNQFQEKQSPVTMGVVVKIEAASHKGNYTRLAFNIQDEGRLINSDEYIDENTYIREFTIERIKRRTAVEKFDSNEYKQIKNFF